MNPILSKCPTCGKRSLKLVCSDYKTKVRGKSLVVPGLERQECQECGEILFDCDAMERLEAVRSKPRKTTRATR